MFSCSQRSLALPILLLSLSLVACGPLPRPFQPSEKASPGAALFSLDERAGVLIEAVEGPPPAVSERLRAQLVRELLRQDVPASEHAANRASFRLSARPAAADSTDVLVWSLAAPGGDGLLRFELSAPAGGWSQASDASLALVAEEVAIFAAAVVRPPAPVELVVRNGPLLAVPPVDGAPGNGRRALASAMGRALARQGLSVADSLDDAAIVVLGSVHVRPAGPDSDAVTIDWTVMRPDGARLGTVSQNNVVPAGVLDGVWGPIARAVADDGAVAVAGVLQQVGARNPATGGR